MSSQLFIDWFLFFLYDPLSTSLHGLKKSIIHGAIEQKNPRPSINYNLSGGDPLFLAWILYQPFHQFSNHGTFQTKRKIPCISQNRHFKDLKAINKRNAVFPSCQAVVVPHFPEKAAKKGCYGGWYHRAPMTGSQFWENMLFSGQSLEWNNDDQWWDP